MNWRWTRRTELLLLFLASCLLLGPILIDINSVPIHPQAEYTDLLTSHWPNAYFVKSEITARGKIPLWNPLILSGAPLIADPLFGIWYPPTWLTLILPLTPAINLLLILHIFWAAWGMFSFLRQEGLNRSAAIIAGLAFGGTPKLIGHIGLGHVGLVSAVAWTPWMLFCVGKTLSTGLVDLKAGIRWAALSGGVIGVTFLADPRWLIPTSSLALLYGLYRMWTWDWLNKVAWRGSLRTGLIFGTVALGISAGLSLPLSEFLSITTRANITQDTASQLSLPVSNLVKFLVPDLGGWPETLPYVGVIVLGLAIFGILTRSPGWKFWFFISLLALLLSLGDQTPLYSLISSITPGMKFIRVPARFLFISSFGLCVLAGMGVEGIFSAEGRSKSPIRLAALGYGGLTALFGLTLVIIAIEEITSGPFMVAAALALLVLTFFSMDGAENLKLKQVLWAGAVILDMLFMAGSLIEMVPEDQAFGKSKLAEAISQEDADIKRIFSTSYSIPQQTAAINSLQLADGINPLQMAGYWDYMAEAVGFAADGYSVTLPPFPDGDPSTSQPFNLNAEALGYLNIEQVFSSYPLQGEGLEFSDLVEGTYIYTVGRPRPRAWMESTTDSDEEWRDVISINWSPNEIIIHAEGPGQVVLSELSYPGWQVSVDDEAADLLIVEGLFRGVSVGEGEHIVRFSFHPRSVYLGAGISVLTIIALAWVWLKR